MRQIAVIALLYLGLSMPAWAEGPSFDCAKAVSQAEKAICASGDLAALDRQIAEEYQMALSLKQTTVAEQREWLSRRDTACAPETTADCLRQVMMERHSFLTRRPKGYTPPIFRGRPGFDCDKAESASEKAICSNKELSELDAAVMKADEAAEREGLRVMEPNKRWPHLRKTACEQYVATDGKIACLKSELKLKRDELERVAKYGDYVKYGEHGGRGWKYPAYIEAGNNSYSDVMTITSAADMATHISAISAAGANVTSCEQMAGVTHARAGQEGNDARDFAFGGLCETARDGKRNRELVCVETYGAHTHVKAIGDRQIGSREIAIFTAINCDAAVSRRP